MPYGLARTSIRREQSGAASPCTVMQPLEVPRGRHAVPPRCVEAFARDGFLIVPGLFAAEAELLHEAAKGDARAYGTSEATGARNKIWFPGDNDAHDVYNGICHSSRMVDTLEALMRDEVWLYHKKVVTKDAESFQPEAPESIGSKDSNAWAWVREAPPHSCALRLVRSRSLNLCALVCGVSSAASGLRM